MGFFKRSKSDKANQSEHDDRDGDADPNSDQSPGDAYAEKPRCRHYVFAHVALRNVAFEYPVEIIAALGSEKADSLLDDLWASVEQACSGEGDDDRQPVDRKAIRVHRLRINEFPTAIVEMPTPRGATEAFFAAIVLCVDMDAKGLTKEDIVVRYFTLEKGAKLSPGDPDRTVLCEWSADGSHVNHGNGPAANIAKFTDAVRASL